MRFRLVTAATLWALVPACGRSARTREAMDAAPADQEQPEQTQTTEDSEVEQPGRMVLTAPDCPGCTFPPPGAAPCPSPDIAPTLVYPPDGVLLPPNMNELSVQWTPRRDDVQLFEVAFEGDGVDVRVATRCRDETTDSRGGRSGGCQLALDKALWDLVATPGSKVTVSVRASSDGACATPSTHTIQVLFAEETLTGKVYYWKASIDPGVSSGDIWVKLWGDAAREKQVTPSTGQCFGCHTVSRDGQRMLVEADDPDQDDEYSDVFVQIQDLVVGRTFQPWHSPGFQTFSPDASLYLASDGLGANNRFELTGAPTNVFYVRTGITGDRAIPNDLVPGVGPPGARPTMPDWSPDGASVAFVMPTKVATWPRYAGDPKSEIVQDDNHVFGGSLWTMAHQGAGLFDPPVPLVVSSGENNYYPSYSPDGEFLAYSRVPLHGTLNEIDACTGTTPQRACPNDSYANPEARIVILPLKTGTPLDPTAINGSPAEAPTPASNSWPRWSPFVQTYKGEKLLWVAFSSTRDYGLLVRNHMPGMYQCYTAESYEIHEALGEPFSASCQQPQIWMAAVNLDTASATAGGHDPTYPAFWMPFQDIQRHSHTPQWGPP